MRDLISWKIFSVIASKCRVFAPLYRQVTVTTLRWAMAGDMTQAGRADREMAYADVKAAWNQYLAKDNKKRGVVLIGHSQGAGLLKRLIVEEIEGKPVASRLVSAMLLGSNVLVPQGQTVGGDFKSTPLCTSAFQTGCVISYVTFRWEAPPPPAARFGRTDKPGMQVACTNPAALTGGISPLKAILTAQPTVASDPDANIAWTTAGQVDTRFVAVPGLLTGSCVNDENGSRLAVVTYADPADPRLDKIPGDLAIGGNVQTDWGLHRVDVHVAMGDLQKATITHVFEMRSVLSPAQAEVFDAAAWAPVDVPRPTYTMKAKAEREPVEPAATVDEVDTRPLAARYENTPVEDLPFDGMALDEDYEELPQVYRAG